MEFFRKREPRAPEIVDLDALYYNRNSKNFLQSLRSFPLLFNLSTRQLERQVIDELKTNNVAIHAELYKMYSGNLRKAVSAVFGADDYDDKYFDIQQRLEANVSRFAAYKAYHATEQIKRQRYGDDGELLSDADYEKRAKTVFNTFNRYQAAEYNTAVARSRTARQWQNFNENPIANELYPNLKWLPSRSATPREEHIAFYGLVLPKTDPFWQHNQPGNLWNCKCDWEASDEPAHEVNLPIVNAAKGLEGNPAITGEIFTDKAAYTQALSKDKTASKTLREVHYDDSKSSLKINVFADKKEIAGNVRTGRILAKDNDVKIRPHVLGEKNPEYEINELIADAKRIEKYNGVGYGFSKAIAQGCKAVIIDLDKNFSNRNINIHKLARKITWRKDDFASGRIVECYVVYKGKYVVIKEEDILMDKTYTILQKIKP